MPRKNNPKQTVEKILSVSARLFTEKGFEKTSMQDIVNAIGMSKGAIFYHFKSKEEILQAVMELQAQYTEQTLATWIEEFRGSTAKETLIGLLEKNLHDQQMHSLDSTLSSQILNPHFVLSSMQDSVNKSAPFFAKLMREGNEDGSIHTDYPDECAEVFFLLMNIWCDPMIFACDSARLEKRLKFLQQLMMKMGADIINDELIANYLTFIERLYGDMLDEK